MRLRIETVQILYCAQPYVLLGIGQTFPKPLVRLLSAVETQHLQRGGAHGLLLALGTRGHHLGVDILALAHDLERANLRLAVACGQYYSAPFEQIGVVQFGQAFEPAGQVVGPVPSHERPPEFRLPGLVARGQVVAAAAGFARSAPATSCGVCQFRLYLR